MTPMPNVGSNVRIGDAERDRALSSLSEHYVAGRLTRQEYDERAAAVWAARTEGDLAPLFRDLPALPRSRTQSRPLGKSRRFDPPMWPFVGVMFIVMIVADAPWWVWMIAIWFWFTGGMFRLVRRVHRHLDAKVGKRSQISGSWRADRGSWS
ncbi:MAG: DUF1707 domain-containing protein [Nocardioidaceae bacterium]